MKIKICADSTCDLSKELLAKYNVDIMPLHITLGDNDYRDGIDLTPNSIYDYYAQTKALPKSGACSTAEYDKFFSDVLVSGYDAIVHFTISAEMSSSYNNALVSSRNFENVFVVDSRHLSTAIGLLVLDACDMVQQGYSAKEVFEHATKRAQNVQDSFIVEKLDFLYKGGRCSSLVYLGANLLMIRPCLVVKDGKINVGSKPFGKFIRCVGKYCDEIFSLAKANADAKRCFITHTKMDSGIAEYVLNVVKSWGIFEEIIETDAGCTVTTHCGANTIGILFLNN